MAGVDCTAHALTELLQIRAKTIAISTVSRRVQGFLTQMHELL